MDTSRSHPIRFLMCPPDYFEVVYEINPWMCVERKVDQLKASCQWKALYEFLSAAEGVKVDLIDPVAKLPDMVFTANAGLVHKRLFIRSQFRYGERKGEEPYFEKWFRRKGYITKTVPQPFVFEGEGDALLMNEELYTGFHFRSDVEAHDAVAGYLKKSYFALELQDRRFYHLDTCFAPVSSDTAVFYPEAFAPYAQLTLFETVKDPVEVPQQEALRFACNLIAFEKQIIMPQGCPQTASALTDRGYEVHQLDFSEFMKAGGAAKCLVLKI
ncbi:MAG: amidinotransferase [Candidatus Omnitrophica bacterium]|nr:amidinotransferase [Candidatus Omnitrophota bacterium]